MLQGLSRKEKKNVCPHSPVVAERTRARGLQDSERQLPKGGKKKFAYTKKGKAAAKKHAKKTGKKVRSNY